MSEDFIHFLRDIHLMLLQSPEHVIIPVYFPFSSANPSSSAVLSSLNTGFENDFKKLSKFTFICFVKPCVFYISVDLRSQLI